MNHIIICFHQEISAFFRLPDKTNYILQRRAGIKDIIEAHGVPHTEVGELLVNGLATGFDYIPCPGEEITVNPVQVPADVTRPTLLRPTPYPEVKFIADVNVGKLAILLRMLGQNTLWSNSYGDREIAALSAQERRIVLSTDRGLLKRKEIVHGRLIRACNPDDQLREVAGLYSLDLSCIFSRCLKCNQILEPIPKSKIIHRLKPRTRKFYDYFEICPGCERIYWRGSHWEKMCTRIQNAG
ncbi:Mut7-C RNAse domain-containing protein [Desulfonatronospira sp.]|uniref:Mut7-C RNAse domain-containing protein n=1 Tax=Desulfonatronospira sp. TaxID=1962951 RepID=UPI0025C56B84|nr:Mut7-C RNAse domain-containing protein [Desulfonatronospira sp.]